ncbi:hypothetical protein CR970_03720 [Candidatus Saccharibacteria bacterium]|nr:MAG: hypothetical protein CR970_03720 [Candidatus Saccharibacteria bacterium]
MSEQKTSVRKARGGTQRPAAVKASAKPSSRQKAKPVERPERVFAFIDSQNLNLGVQKFGWKIDWRKFRRFLTDKYGVTKAFMFIGYIPENEALYEQMHDAGYLVVLKPTFDMTRLRPEDLEKLRAAEGHATPKGDGDKEDKQVKGNIDAELVLWAMKEMSNYEKAIIISGDGDFYSLVEYLVGKKRLKHVLVPSAHYSSLYNQFDEYVERLDAYKRQLSYRPRRKKPAAAE